MKTGFITALSMLVGAVLGGAAIQALRGLIEVQTRALDEDLPGALQEVVERLAGGVRQAAE